MKTTGHCTTVVFRMWLRRAVLFALLFLIPGYKLEEAVEASTDTNTDTTSDTDINADTGTDTDDEEEEEETRQAEYVNITTPIGPIQGVKFENAVEGLNAYFAFLNIPYAEAPDGDSRFEPSVPKRAWEDLLYATDEETDRQCMQLNPIIKSAVGTEDCLYLNVYTPQDPNNSTEKFPVIVFLHGGGFHTSSGSSESNGADFLLSHNVVLVTINFRLSIFGFFSTNDKRDPGNLGLKDQVLALQWVQNYINFFGGNADSVTLMGQSSGAASVHFHMMSPLSKGLFHKAVLLSGTANSPWAFALNTKRNVLDVAIAFNCSLTDFDLLKKCLREVPAKDLTVAQYNALPADISKFEELFCFIPTIEPYSSKAFIHRYPANIIKAGNYMDIPLIITLTKYELLMIKAALHSSHMPPKLRDKFIYNLNKKPENLFPSFKNYKSTKKCITKKVRELYFGNNSISLSNLDSVVEMLTDMFYLVPMYEMVTSFVNQKTSPLFLGYFTIDSDYSFFRQMAFFPGISGASHGDESAHLFYKSGKFTEEKSNGFQMMKKMTKIITDFATYGNATPDNYFNITWRPFTIDNHEYLDLGEELIPKQALASNRIKFWNELKETSC